MESSIAPPDIKIVVLISADAEWGATRSIIRNAHIYSSPFGEWFRTQINFPENNNSGAQNYSVVFFQGGWGKISAAASTQYIIDYWNPELIINLGTCGGFKGNIERGTIILVDRTIVYDIYEQMGSAQDHVAHYTTCIDLDWLKDKYPVPVLRTHLVSGDRDLIIDDIPYLKAKYQAVAGDWESGAIAYVAALNGVHTLILRGVTDLVDAEGGEAYGNIDLFEKNARDIMQQLITQLPLWIKISNIG